EGMTVVSAAGDTGAAGCDPQVSQDPALFGPAVNASASTPYNIAIGGTAFAENGLDATYWAANNRKNLSSAIGYIPETVWQETCDPNIDPNQCFNSGLFFLDAGSGGPSSCVRSRIFDDGSFSCDAGYPKPAWQSGLGVPRDGVRDLPDVSFAAAAQHDGYLVCVEGSCQTTTNNGQTILQNASIVGGTSAGAPTFSGALALLEQKHGAYQGLLNFKLYQLAASENIAGCNSSHKLDPTFKSSCIFYDVTAGNNDVPGQPGAQAATGFDLASGLGSVNIANLVDKWTSVAKLPSATQFALREGRVIQHGQPIPMHVDVASRHGSGSPSGDFSLVTDKFGAVLGGTLSDGVFNGSVNALPGGDYRVFARYAGDAMFEPSESRSIRVNVSPEPSRISVVPWQINLFGFPSIVDSPVPYGQPVGVQVDLAGASGVGSPGGSIVIRVDGVKNLGPYPLNAAGNAFVWLDHLDMKGLLPGAHKFVVTYSGDGSFEAITAPAANITIQKDHVIEIFVGTLQGNPDPDSPTVLTAGQPIDLEVALSGLEEPLLGAQLPTGTAVIYECVSMGGARRCDQWKALTGAITLHTTGLLGPGVVQAHFRTTFTAGDHLLAASYSGNAHYSSISVDDFVGAVANPISVAPAVAATISVKPSVSTIDLGQAVNYSVALSPTKSGAAVPTGTITLVDVNANPIAGPLTLQQGHASFTVPWYQAGQDLVVALYSGDNKYGQLYSSIATVTVNPAHPTAMLSVAGSAKPGSTTDLTVVVGGGPSDPHIGTPGQELGQVEYLDSVDGAPAQLLGGAPQTLTVGNHNTSVNIFPATLQAGHHVITARFLGTADWTSAQSNTITLSIGKSNNLAVAGGKGE
ncbi:MAG TPA: Ig-like domain repeat protein, partial [Candidatus Acidoferrum sp.]